MTRVRNAAVGVLATLLVGCFMPLTCGGPPPLPASEFGAYHNVNAVLHLSTGDTMTVYRVKYWTFTDGSPPRLQLEYASHVPATDTAAVFAQDRTVWPSFAPYLDHLNLDHAILTATAFSRTNAGVQFTSRHSYGVLVDKGPDGVWRLEKHADALPPADASGTPRIVLPSGAPMAFFTTPPTRTE